MNRPPTTNDDVLRELRAHMRDDQTNFDDGRENFATIRRVLFGDEETGEKGMKQKQDEMYDILVQAKGWKSLGSTILLIAAVIAVLKGWFSPQ